MDIELILTWATGFIKGNLLEILVMVSVICFALITAVKQIVEITPTEKDDEILEKIENSKPYQIALKVFGFFIKKRNK